MIRNVDLVSYLPPFLSEFKENTATLEAENPEFAIVWDAKERVLRNEFIETADEYGISRFEKLLGIYPDRTDTLEARRVRVKARWFNGIPYTMRVLLERLIEICGEGSFTVEKKFQQYEIRVHTVLPVGEQMNGIKYLLDYMLPANMKQVIIQESIIEIDETELEDAELVNFNFTISIPALAIAEYGMGITVSDRFGLPFWNWHTLNGSDTFDGSWLWDAYRVYQLGLGTVDRFTVDEGISDVGTIFGVPVKVEIEEAVNNPKQGTAAKATTFAGEDIDNLTVETHTHNYWFFDGSQNFDGSRQFNSYYRKEEEL